MKKQDKALILALSSVLLWSTVATALKIALRYFDYLNLLFYSSLFSVIALFLIIVITKKTSELKSLNKKTIIKSILLGILNPFLYYLVLFKAYSLLRAQEALVLNYTWAVMVVVLSAVILKRKLRLPQMGAILISFAGVFVIASKGSFSFSFEEPLGIGLALGSSIIWALFWIYNIDDKTDETIRLLISFLSGLFFITITILATSGFTNPSTEGLFASAYVGLFEMGITFVLWLKALTLTDNIARTSNLVYLSPFLSLLFINLVIGESISLSSFIGLILILSGIIVQQSMKKLDT
jgi:drug/metabolite transporter (DMT)-like permease